MFTKLFSQLFNHKDCHHPEIDLVCCWVNLDEEYWAEVSKYKHHAVQSRALNKGRFRQLGELEFSIPLALKNLPWLRKVFIVTNGQLPPQQLLELPKVHHITHDEFFKDKSYLPTFSYHAIHANLCFIDDLAENFILTTDDIFITQPLQPEDFLGKAGFGKFTHTRTSLVIDEPENVWKWNLSSTEKALAKRYGDLKRMIFPHAPQLFKKSECINLWSEFAEELNVTCSNKFRENENVIFRGLYPYFMAYKHWGLKHYNHLLKVSEEDVGYYTRDDYQVIPLQKLGKGDWEQRLQAFTEGRTPTFLCLNDNIPEQAYEQTSVVVREYLQAIFKDIKPS